MEAYGAHDFKGCAGRVGGSGFARHAERPGASRPAGRSDQHEHDTASRRHAAAGRSLHQQEFLSRRAVLARQALRALQHAARAHRHGARPAVRRVGRLQQATVQSTRSSARIRTRPPKSTTTRCSRKPRKPAVRPNILAPTLPNWDGHYRRLQPEEQWVWGRNLQTATMLSLLTPEYRKRMVQQNYHEVVNNSPQWDASFCYPEGFMRWWAEASLGGDIEVMMTPDQVQFLSGIADNFLRRVLDRTDARAAGAAVVRRDRRVLERQHARRMDRERPGLDAVTFDVRVQQPDGDDRSLHARAPTARPSPSTRRSTIPRRSRGRFTR